MTKQKRARFLVFDKGGGLKNFVTRREAIAFKSGLTAAGIKRKVGIEKTQAAGLVDNTFVLRKSFKKKKRKTRNILDNF